MAHPAEQMTERKITNDKLYGDFISVVTLLHKKQKAGQIQSGSKVEILLGFLNGFVSFFPQKPEPNKDDYAKAFKEYIIFLQNSFSELETELRAITDLEPKLQFESIITFLNYYKSFSSLPGREQEQKFFEIHTAMRAALLEVAKRMKVERDRIAAEQAKTEAAAAGVAAAPASASDPSRSAAAPTSGARDPNADRKVGADETPASTQVPTLAPLTALEKWAALYELFIKRGLDSVAVDDNGRPLSIMREIKSPLLRLLNSFAADSRVQLREIREHLTRVVAQLKNPAHKSWLRKYTQVQDKREWVNGAEMESEYNQASRSAGKMDFALLELIRRSRDSKNQAEIESLRKILDILRAKTNLKPSDVAVNANDEANFLASVERERVRLGVGQEKAAELRKTPYALLSRLDQIHKFIESLTSFDMGDEKTVEEFLTTAKDELQAACAKALGRAEDARIVQAQLMDCIEKEAANILVYIPAVLKPDTKKQAEQRQAALDYNASDHGGGARITGMDGLKNFYVDLVGEGIAGSVISIKLNSWDEVGLKAALGENERVVGEMKKWHEDHIRQILVDKKILTRAPRIIGSKGAYRIEEVDIPPEKQLIFTVQVLVDAEIPAERARLGLLFDTAERVLRPIKRDILKRLLRDKVKDVFNGHQLAFISTQYAISPTEVILNQLLFNGNRKFIKDLLQRCMLMKVFDLNTVMMLANLCCPAFRITEGEMRKRIEIEYGAPLRMNVVNPSDRSHGITMVSYYRTTTEHKYRDDTPSEKLCNRLALLKDLVESMIPFEDQLRVSARAIEEIKRILDDGIDLNSPAAADDPRIPLRMAADLPEMARMVLLATECYQLFPEVEVANSSSGGRPRAF